MNTQAMKNQLLRKFSPVALRSAIELQTNYRAATLQQLNASEVEELYYRFFPRPLSTVDVITKQQQEMHLKSLRSTILKDAQYIGLYDPQDWTRFNEFMLKRSPLKKPLPQYALEEFEVLIKQFKSLKSKYQREARTTGTKAWHHKHKLPIPSAN